MTNKEIRVVELFAGVGGFRIGLEGWEGKSATSGYTKKINSPYKVIWSNQWEPSTKIQHASIIYEDRFGSRNHSNIDINLVDINDIPDHDLLVGGFPCQDYSVATTLKNSKGLIGKKGVLWWNIHKILANKTNKPNYLFLENVDRLLISPSSQRGRDFAIMLQSLNELGYAVEWRVINAADYGMPQRRRRVFILGYKEESEIYNEIISHLSFDWILQRGTMANAFPISNTEYSALKEFSLKGSIVSISDNFNKVKSQKLFENAGLMIKGNVMTLKTSPSYNGKIITLGDIIDNSINDSDLFIDENDLSKWIYLKGPKKELRKNSTGFEYHYSEGGMIFPDSLDRPSRTIITGEGGKAPSRFKHVIKTLKGLRRLAPLELERLNMFPDNHTSHHLISDTRRAFFMGNALVVGVVEKIGQSILNKINNESSLQSE